MEHFFLRIYDLLSRHKWAAIFLPIVFLMVMAVLCSNIKLKEDIAGFLPDGDKNEQLGLIYKKLSLGNEIFVRFSVTDSLADDQRVAALMDGAEIFAQHLDSLAGKKLIKDIVYRIDASKALEVSSFITENIPYFLEASDYARMDSIAQTKSFHHTFENNRSLMLSPMGIGLQENLLNDPFHFSLPVLQRLKQLQLNEHYVLEDDYIFTADKKQLIMFAFSANGGSETAQNALLADAFDQARAAMPHNVQVSYFGAPLVAVANASQIKTDALRSIAIALGIIIILLFLFFRSIKPLFLVSVPVLFGAMFSLTLLYIFQGSVSTIALGAGSVIVGIAINYSLHYLVHFQHHPDHRTVLRDLIDPMVTGNITTVGAFLSLLLLSAPAMRDLGYFAAFALIGTILFVLCFLPHWAKVEKTTALHLRLERSMSTSFEQQKWLIIACIFITVVLYSFSNKVQFETDFNKINYMTRNQQAAFNEIKNTTTLGDQSLYFVSTGHNLNEALRAYEQVSGKINRLKREGVILKGGDLWSFLPSDSLQKVKIDRWNRFCVQHKQQLLQGVATEEKCCGFSANAFQPFTDLMNKDFKVQPVGFFNILTEAFLKESIVRDAHKTAIISILYANPAKTQKVYDSLNGQQNAFVFDAKTLTSKMIKSLSNDFNLVFYICGCLVFFFLWFSFGRFELSLIAFLPMAISWIWILGIMGLLDIRFNIVNIILATFIFGLGDDYTIFIVDGLMYEYAYGKKMLSSYKTSVFLSALMMLVGIGVLIFAAHPAMRSLAEVTIIGMFCVVLIAFILPPLIFKWMVKTKGQYRLMPVSWINAVLTVYSFVVFLIGSLWLTIYGFWLLKLQKPTDHRKLLFHKALCGASRFVVKYIPGVKCRMDNEPNEDFENPAIIICNHQSHLDLMYLLMLSPKVIVLTNKWVWHCPFYGMIIRFADFYPVVNGIESNVEMLGALMDKGYSIAIFPEGTRSVDCSIKRFHKGAFYLAEKLHRDIVPVIFHGIGHVLPKKEFLLRRGEIHVKCLPRIKANSLQFGVHYVENSKALRHYVIEEYAALAQKVETPDYFKSAVKGNYRYKGKTIEAEVSRSLQNMAVIKKMIAALPPNSIVLMLNCGIGALSLLTALARKEVTILAMDECEDNIAVASNCSLVPKNLTYKVGKVNDVNPEAFARIIDLQKIRNNEA